MPRAITRLPPGEDVPPVDGGGGTMLEAREARAPWAEGLPPAELSEGGGGTTAALPAFRLEGTRCASTESAGAGAMMAEGARFMSLKRRPVTSVGGGGAITDESSDGAEVLRSTAVGGGATIGVFSEARETGARSVAETGTGTEWSPQATMFGVSMSRSSWTLGGATMVWWLLRASGGTERIGCLANSGSALRSEAGLRSPVSSGGRYSEALKYKTCDLSKACAGAIAGRDGRIEMPYRAAIRSAWYPADSAKRRQGKGWLTKTSDQNLPGRLPAGGSGGSGRS